LVLSPSSTGGIGGQQPSQEAAAAGGLLQGSGYAEHGARIGGVVEEQAIDRSLAPESAEQKQVHGGYSHLR
jgi:hypothetical protein